MHIRPLPNILIGVALISVSALVSVLFYLQHSPRPDIGPATEAPRAESRVPDLLTVVTARRPIKRGQRVTPDMLTQIRVEAPVPLGTFQDPAAILDAVALQDISRGQIVTQDSLLRDEGVRPGLSILVPDGLRAVALRVNDEVSVGEFVRPNDRVDIHLVLPSDRVARAQGQDVRLGDHTESSILLQNVLILSTGETLASPDGQNAAPMKNITVAVTPQEALLLAIAKEVGKFYLALRKPTDEALVQAAPAHVGDLLAPSASPRPRRMPDPPPPTSSVPPAPKPRDSTVTVIRGSKSTVQKFSSDDAS